MALESAFTSAHAFEALSLVAGVIVGGYASTFLPSFSYSAIVYSVVGVALVIVGISIDGAGAMDYAGGFVTGVGASWAANIVSAFSGLLKQ